MMFFFSIARAIRIAFITLRAIAGILILGHGMNRWVKNHR